MRMNRSRPSQRHASLFAVLLILLALIPAAPLTRTARAADPTFTPAALLGNGSYTEDVAVGDLNGDGALDLVFGNYQQPSQVYLNNASSFVSTADVNPDGDHTQSVAVGDLNADGALDLVLGNNGPSQVYLNDGHASFPLTASLDSYSTTSVAVGDLNGDGTLDLVLGNNGPSRVYLNDGQAHFTASAPALNPFGDPTTSVAVGDLNGDGALDLVLGNGGTPFSYQPSQVYLNDGHAHFTPAAAPLNSESNNTQSVAVGDLNGDGTLNLVLGSTGSIIRYPTSPTEPSQVYLNTLADGGRLPNNPPAVGVIRPGPTKNANFFSAPEIHSNAVIPISYTLFDPDGDPVRAISVTFSLDGGGSWRTAVPTNTQTTDLAASPAGTPHTFNWDIFASGFFGQSDDVVFRIVAYTDLHPHRNGVPGPYQRPYASATTFPFRVRGTQVRVVLPGAPAPAPRPAAHKIYLPLVGNRAISGLVFDATPPAGALVHRILKGQLSGQPLADSSGRPFHTDYQGYLQGRGRVDQGDGLVALMPIAHTDTYTLYYTSAAPTATGLTTATVTSPGVQVLTVSPKNPFILFNLKVSLEWDARYDTQFLAQLASDLKRTSAAFYDWTNGQAALGDITVYQDKQHWNDAHLRVYATNHMRPNANQGGIVASPRLDPLKPGAIYTRGQVRIGAVWNRYGEAGGALGEDWPRTLAHELGHYTLYLDDNYIGLDANGVLVPVASCTGTAMSDPYRDDYSEFHPDDGWLPGCAGTLSNQGTDRSDWSTIGTFYPWLNKPASLASLNPGPSLLPLDVTRVHVVDPNPTAPTTALAVPIFLLSRQEDHSSYLPGNSARAFLFKRQNGANSPIADIVDLGKPTLDRVLARGARPGDRVCVYEPAAGRLGCQENIVATDQQLPLKTVNWHPDLIATPVTSRTRALAVMNAPDGLSLKARLFPAGAAPSPERSLLFRGAGRYTGSFSLPEPTFSGYVQVWVEETARPRREIVADYTLGGNPGSAWGLDAPRGNPGSAWGLDAPVISADGQAILFTQNDPLAEGTFFALQATTNIPSTAWPKKRNSFCRLATADCKGMRQSTVASRQ